LDCFEKLEALYATNPSRMALCNKFLSEWGALKPGEKANARNHDPFVKEFEGIFDPVRNLTALKALF